MFGSVWVGKSRLFRSKQHRNLVPQKTSNAPSNSFCFMFVRYLVSWHVSSASTKITEKFSRLGFKKQLKSQKIGESTFGFKRFSSQVSLPATGWAGWAAQVPPPRDRPMGATRQAEQSSWKRFNSMDSI